MAREFIAGSTLLLCAACNGILGIDDAKDAMSQPGEAGALASGGTGAGEHNAIVEVSAGKSAQGGAPDDTEIDAGDAGRAEGAGTGNTAGGGAGRGDSSGGNGGTSTPSDAGGGGQTGSGGDAPNGGKTGNGGDATAGTNAGDGVDAAAGTNAGSSGDATAGTKTGSGGDATAGTNAGSSGDATAGTKTGSGGDATAGTNAGNGGETTNGGTSNAETAAQGGAGANGGEGGDTTNGGTSNAGTTAEGGAGTNVGSGGDTTNGGTSSAGTTAEGGAGTNGGEGGVGETGGPRPVTCAFDAPFDSVTLIPGLNPEVSQAGYSTDAGWMSDDGLVLYVSAVRPEQSSSQPRTDHDLFRTTRTTTSEPFAPLERLSDADPFVHINTSLHSERFPLPSDDEEQLLFQSDQNVDPRDPAQLPQYDLFIAIRSDPNRPFSAPVPLPSPLNTYDREDLGSGSLDGELFFSSKDDIYVARPGGTSGFVVELIPDPISMPDMRDSRPIIDRDRLTLYFTSRREGRGDIYFARRADTASPFSEPLPVPGVNTANAEEVPTWISADGCTLIMNSGRRSDGPSSTIKDLYFATRGGGTD